MSASEGTQAPVSKKKQQKGQVLHLEEFKSILNANESQPSRSWGDEDPVEEDRNYSRDRYNGDGGRGYRDSPKGGYNREIRDDGKSSDDSKWERSSETKENDSDRERGGYRSNDYGGRGGERNDYGGRGGDRNNYRDRNDRSEYNRSDRGDYGGRGGGGDRGDYGSRGDRGDGGGRGERGDYGSRGDRGDYGSRGDRSDYGGRGDRGDGGRGDRDYGSRGDRDRERNYDNKPKELPTQPPWDAYVGNLRYELEEGAIADFFSRDCKVKRVRLQRNKDTQQPLGYAYVEFEDLESLKTALNLNGENFQSRNIRVDVATRAEKSRSDSSDKWTRNPDSHPAERSERGGYNRGGSRDYPDRNREFRSRDNDRNRDYDRNRDSDRDQEKGEERQRPKLNLLPRSVDNPVGSVPSTKGTPKSDPFGGARPRDESAFVKKKQDTPKETAAEPPPPPEPEKKETQKYTPPHASNRNSKADRQDWRNDNKDQKDSKGGSSGRAWGKPKEDEREHSEESRPQSKGREKEREKTEEAPKRAAKREEKPKVSNKSNHNPFAALSSDD